MILKWNIHTWKCFIFKELGQCLSPRFIKYSAFKDNTAFSSARIAIFTCRWSDQELIISCWVGLLKVGNMFSTSGRVSNNQQMEEKLLIIFNHLTITLSQCPYIVKKVLLSIIHTGEISCDVQKKLFLLREKRLFLTLILYWFYYNFDWLKALCYFQMTLRMYIPRYDVFCRHVMTSPPKLVDSLIEISMVESSPRFGNIFL